MSAVWYKAYNKKYFMSQLLFLLVLECTYRIQEQCDCIYEKKLNSCHSQFTFLITVYLYCITDGILLIEADRVLRPGGYFVWTSPITNTQEFHRNKDYQKRWNFVNDFAENLCWEVLSQQDETVVWRKTSKKNCYSSR